MQELIDYQEWVMKHSKHRGVVYSVHVTIAGIAQDNHDRLVKCSQMDIVIKARTTRRSVIKAIQILLEANDLLLIKHSNSKFHTNIYRLEMNK